MKKIPRTQFACLSVLRVMPMSGYKIAESCKDWFSHCWNESYGQIYPTLKKLHANGDIEKLPPQLGQRGNVYKITAQGKETLIEWLHVPASAPSLRDEYYLKFFNASVVPNTLHLEHLQRKRQHLKDCLADTKTSLAHLERVPGEDTQFWKLMIRYGLISYKTELAWIDEAEAFLNERLQHKHA